MVKCSCEAVPRIRQGTPVKDGDKSYWVQIYTCVNPNCENCGKDIGERRVNIFDESETEEKMY